MKFKNLNITLFLSVSIVFGVLLIPSLFYAFAFDEGTLKPDDTIGSFFAQLFYVLRFPTLTFFDSRIQAGDPLLFFAGLFINCVFYALIIERIATLLGRTVKLKMHNK